MHVCWRFVRPSRIREYIVGKPETPWLNCAGPRLWQPNTSKTVSEQQSGPNLGVLVLLAFHNPLERYFAHLLLKGRLVDGPSPGFWRALLSLQSILQRTALMSEHAFDERCLTASSHEDAEKMDSSADIRKPWHLAVKLPGSRNGASVSSTMAIDALAEESGAEVLNIG